VKELRKQESRKESGKKIRKSKQDVYKGREKEGKDICRK
jgi:hypothetical protein